MEGLIVAIIIFLISSVLGRNKKEEKPTKQMPPFSPQKAPPFRPVPMDSPRTSSRQSLDDFANEMFGQLSKKAEPVRQRKPEVIAKAEEVVKPTVTRETSINRPALGDSRPLVKKALQSSIDVVPRTREQLAQAIVTAEILAPPKAKQRK